MKTWPILIFLVISCSTGLKDKDFESALDSPVESDKNVKVEAPSKLLAKFQVEDVVENSSSKTSQIKKKKESSKKSKKKQKRESHTGMPEKKLERTLKDDLKKENKKNKEKEEIYPENLKVINEAAQKVWSLYKPNHFVGEKIYLDIHYLGMTVGKIMVSNSGKKMVNKQEVWHFHSRFKSAPFYSSIYELDDTIDTYVTTKDFLSVRYSLMQRESKQDVDDLQLYDRKKLKTYWFYKRKKSDGNVKNKEKKEFIPYYSIDPFSVLFLFQGLPLRNNDVYEIPIVNKAEILILKSIVEGREVIEVEDNKKVNAIRLHATTTYTGKTLKSGDLYFWFSDDEKKNLLKAKAKIKIGNVTAEIVDSE